VRRVDPQQLLEEAAERVEHHVKSEKRRRSEADEAVEDEQEDSRRGHDRNS
jgi:hypothetical protein